MSRARPRRAALAAGLAALAACHVARTAELTRPGEVRRTPRPARPTAGAPALVMTEDGGLRFVEPLRCPTEEQVALETTVERRTDPNLATVVVGVIVTSAAALAAVSGLTGADGVRDPRAALGLGGLAVGLPLAIGPFVGTRRALRAGPPGELRRAGPEVPCGARPLAATAATLRTRGLEVHGAIAADGTFAVSPFAIVDAFAPAAVPAWDVTATVETPAGPRAVAGVLEAGELARRAGAFLARGEVDARVTPLRWVPGVAAGPLDVRLVAAAGGPALRLALPLRNDGPGESCALRGHLTASDPAVDGRVLYLGRLAAGQAAGAEVEIPLSPAAAARLRGATLELSIELFDAHGTAPGAPVRYRGAVLTNPSR